MKTILKVILMFAFVVFANTLFASGNLKVNIFPLSSEKAVVAISSLTGSNLKISIVDEKGSIVYFKETTDFQNNYRKVFDFSDLEEGTYQLSVHSNDLTTKCTFNIDRNEIKVGEEKTMIEPFFGYENGILKYTFLNFQKENVTLYFYDKNQMIFSKKIGRNFNIFEALNLSKLDKGYYLAVLSTGDKDYRYNIKID